ncbi:MAG: hypothetical protein IJX65_02995 [Alistipes sp.]|nr:hypothetical protein [Alistipes sp.]
MFFKFDIITELLDLDYYPYKEFLMVYTAILVLFVLAASLLRCLCTPKDSSSPAARNYLFASLLLLTFTAAAPNMIGYKLNYLAVNSEEGYIVCDQLPASDKYARRLIVNSEHGVDTLYVSNPKFWYEDYYYRVGSANDSWLYRLCRRYLDHKYQTMEE